MWIVADSLWTRSLARTLATFYEARNAVVKVANRDFIDFKEDDTVIFILETEESIWSSTTLGEVRIKNYGFCCVSDEAMKAKEKMIFWREAVNVTPVNTRVSRNDPLTFTMWMENLWMNIGSSITVTPNFVLSSTYANEVVAGYMNCKVLGHELMSHVSFPRQSFLVTFDLSGTGFEYRPGDHVAILPENQNGNVKKLLHRLKMNGSELVDVKNPINESESITVFELLKRYVNIQGLVNRKMLYQLAKYAEDPEQAAQLISISTDLAGDSEFAKLIKGNFALSDVLEKFSSINMSLNDILCVSPPMMCRKYSACSSPLKVETQVEILFTHLSFISPDGSEFLGTNSQYMKCLKVGDYVRLRMFKGFKDVELSPGSKYFGIALGAGVSMLRGIGQHFHCLKKSGLPDSGLMCLYYGVRHAEKDFLFKKEFEQLQEDGVLILKTAFSHDQPEFRTPVNNMREDPEPVGKILVDNKDKCIFFYCGPAGIALESMINGVRDAIETSRPGTKADEIFAQLKRENRWEIQAFTPNPDPENAYYVNL